MPFKSRGGSSGASVGDWFYDRFVRARSLVPTALFDTVLGMDFDETITVQVVDVVGGAAGVTINGVNGGVFALQVGDAVVAPSSARWEPTGGGATVKMLHFPWYVAALAKFNGSFAVPTLADAAADVLALYVNDNNRVTLGVLGNASGGSTTNFVGRIRTGGGDVDSILGPAIDQSGGSGLYHLWEMWNDGTAVHCAVDGIEFAATMPTADLAFSTAKVSPLSQRTATGSLVEVQWDKHVLIVESPRPGSPD